MSMTVICMQIVTYHVARSAKQIAAFWHVVVERLNRTMDSSMILQAVLGGFKRTAFLDLCDFYSKAPGNVTPHCQHV
jgi:hypothetical protein